MAFVLILVTGSSCQEDFNERYLMVDNYIEFEDAVSTTVAVGKNYPILTRNVTAAMEPISLQINMTGKQFANNQTLAWAVVSEESTAVEGRDYELVGGSSVVLDAQQSQTHLQIQPLASGVDGSVLVLELIGNELIKPMANYKRVGLRINYP